VRPALAVIFVLFAVIAALAVAPEEISWVRIDGAPGWGVAIPQGDRPAGAPGSPLPAPALFPKFPDTKIPLAAGGAFDLASARGKVVVVDYWASWCAPCIKELPHLQQLYSERSAAGLTAVAINADEDAATAAASAKRLGLTMTIGINDPNVYRMLGVRTLPTLLVIDKQGRLRARWDGYKNGLENEIAATVDRLLADDPSGTTRDMATIVSGAEVLRARWFRDLPAAADGVVGLPKATAEGMRILASSGGELLSFDADGEALARLKTTAAAGRLLDFGETAGGAREILGFRPGVTSVGVIELRSGVERTIAIPAPLLDVAVSGGPSGDARRLAFATMRGAALAGPHDDRAVLVTGTESVRGIAAGPGGAALSLREDGAIAALDGSSPPWPHPAAGGARLLVARKDGAIVGSGLVVAAVSGRFLAAGGRQLAVATFTGHLLLIDEVSGHVVFDALWEGLHDLGVVDPGGNGHDVLLVAAGRSVTALGAPAR
jgi:thiol-disulfide isomerase/thioredoxin